MLTPSKVFYRGDILEKQKYIDGLHLTSWRPCWRYNTKEYVISSIVGSSRRGWLTLSATSREIDCKPRILNTIYCIQIFVQNTAINCIIFYLYPSIFLSFKATSIHYRRDWPRLHGFSCTNTWYEWGRIIGRIAMKFLMMCENIVSWLPLIHHLNFANARSPRLVQKSYIVWTLYNLLHVFQIGRFINWTTKGGFYILPTFAISHNILRLFTEAKSNSWKPCAWCHRTRWKF